MRWGRSLSRIVLGRRSESAAARFLKRAGHKILARNYRAPPGEIDIISLDGDTIVFTEVRSLSKDVHADPGEGIRRSKQHRITQTARYYLMQKRSEDRACRFDIITIVGTDRSSRRIEHFINAFEPVRGRKSWG